MGYSSLINGEGERLRWQVPKTSDHLYRPGYYDCTKKRLVQIHLSMLDPYPGFGGDANNFTKAYTVYHITVSACLFKSLDAF